MMKRSSIILMAVMFGAVTFFATSCSKEDVEKDEPVVDIRDQSVGNYNGTVFLFLATNTQVADTTWPENFSVSKNSSNSLSVDFIIDGDIAFTGSKIAEASNGFTFDIEEQTFTDDGNDFTVTGANIVELGGTKYHGAYETSSKEIGAAFNITGNGIDMVMLFSGTKQ